MFEIQKLPRLLVHLGASDSLEVDAFKVALQARMKALRLRFSPSGTLVAGVRHPGDTMAAALPAGTVMEPVHGALEVTFDKDVTYDQIARLVTGLADELKDLIDPQSCAITVGIGNIIVPGGGKYLVAFNGCKTPNVTREQLHHWYVNILPPALVRAGGKQIPCGYGQLHVDARATSLVAASAGFPDNIYDMGATLKTDDLDGFVKYWTDPIIRKEADAQEKDYLDFKSWRGALHETLEG